MRSCRRDIRVDAPPATWQPALHDDVFTATVTCPKCGERCSLKTHTIDVFGFVTPNVSHTCGFNDRLVLEEWRG